MSNTKKKSRAKHIVSGVGKTVEAAATLISGMKPGGTPREGFNTLKNTAKRLGEAGMHFKEGLNHPSWYNKYSSYLVAVNTALRKGVPYEQLAFDDITYAVPSVARINIELMKPITNAGDWDQAINYLMATIRSANAGSISFNQYELERYIWQVRIIHAAYCITRRAYSIIHNVNFYDVTTPASYFAAMGLDYDSFKANAANLRNFGNQLAIQINKLVPLKLDLLERTRWMLSNIFTDSNDAKSQKYMFTVNDVVCVSSTGVFTPVNIASPDIGTNTTGKSYDDFVAAISQIMTVFVSDAKYQDIAGNILRAFQKDSIYPIEVWADMEPVNEVYSEEILTQISNSVMEIANFPTSRFIGFDDNGSLYTNVTYSVDPSIDNPIEQLKALTSYLEAPFINTNKDKLTSDDTLVYTRLMMTAQLAANEDSTFRYDITSMGTERVMNIWLYGSTNTATNKYKITAISKIFTAGAIKVGLAWASFDYMPLTYTLQYTPTIGISDVLFDFNNYGIVSKVDLSTYHGYAVLSMLYTDRRIKSNKTELV